MNHSVTPDQAGVTTRLAASPETLWWQEAVLGAAACFARAPGRRATLVLRRRPGLVERARAVAARLDVGSRIAIEAAGPVVTFRSGCWARRCERAGAARP